MPSETNNPTFEIAVQGKTLDYGLTQLVEQVEYESADGLADVCRIRAINPEFVVSNAKAFQPGNELSVFMGYGTQLKHVGRVIIAKIRPNYPESGMPTVEIVGYDKSHKMMDNSPEKGKEDGGKHGRVHKDKKFSAAVKSIAESSHYKFEPDIDETPGVARHFIQKVGLSDYDFVRGLANITGFLFWVDADKKGKWTLHFKDPATLQIQEKEYAFKYNLGDMTTLLSFQPELLISGFQTKLTVQWKNPKTGAVFTHTEEEESNAAPDVDGADPTGELEGDHTTGADIKLFIDDFSFDLKANKAFQDQADALNWAKQWFRRQRENFVLAQGRIIGVEDVLSRQVHKLEGVESGLEGKYYFSKVKHVMSKEGGYSIQFGARKVVPA